MTVVVPRSWVVATFEPRDLDDEQLQRAVEMFTALSGNPISVHDARLLLCCLEATREPA